MAENESLDLGSSYAKRWDAAFTAVQSGDPCEKVAPKVSKAISSFRVLGIGNLLGSTAKRGVNPD